MGRGSSSSEMAGWSTIEDPQTMALASWPAETMSDRTSLTPRPETTPPRLLIADDQPDVLEAFRLLPKGEGYRIEAAGPPAGILESIDATEFDAVVMDLNYARDTTSGQEGLDLLSQLRSHDQTLPVIVMTAWSSVELAVEAMRRGARDF